MGIQEVSNISYANCWLGAIFLMSPDILQYPFVYFRRLSPLNGMLAIYFEAKFHDHETIPNQEIFIHESRTVLLSMTCERQFIIILSNPI